MHLQYEMTNRGSDLETYNKASYPTNQKEQEW